MEQLIELIKENFEKKSHFQIWLKISTHLILMTLIF